MDKRVENIDDELPFIFDGYVNMLAENEKQKEMKDSKELIDYIANMEKQFNEVLNELHDVKEILNRLQNPSARDRLSKAVNWTQMTIADGKENISQLKRDITKSMKTSLENYKQKGKNGIIKTIDFFHVKEGLMKLQKSLFIAMDKTNDLIQTTDMITNEARNMKRSFKNIGLLFIGKPVRNQEINKLNLVQRGSRLMLKGFKNMTKRTTKMIDSLSDFEKTSVKSDIKKLSDQKPKKKDHTKTEQVR